MKVGRNDPCPCGSGLKYKHCCLGKDEKLSVRTKLLLALAGLVIGSAVIATVATALRNAGGDLEPRPGLVWSEEHRHWHRAQ
ncbi:MAG: SEC-C domain-containing protein [Gammaproteobacteria bacterium]|nr:SEC-C domain-containing protein [Gammaproteobacteria bacterium]